MRARYSLLFTFAIALLGVGLLALFRPGNAGTINVPVSQPSPEETTLPAPSPETTLARLKEALAVTIEESWTGLGNPHKARYQLERQGSGLAGKALFEAGWSEGPTATADITIPDDVTLKFLDTLAQSPAVYGHYEPRIEHTDDYPSLSIAVRLPDQTVRFYSESQGETHVPWGLGIQGNTFVINSDEPARALTLLKPHVKQDILLKLLEEQY
jgi:hypothetical protein